MQHICRFVGRYEEFKSTIFIQVWTKIHDHDHGPGQSCASHMPTLTLFFDLRIINLNEFRVDV